MKIEHIASKINYTNVKNNNQSSAKTTSVLSQKPITQLPDFPKSYIKFNPSFSASLEDELNLETEANRNKRKDDYLWAKNWNSEKAELEYRKQADAEVRIAKKKSTWGISREEELNIRDKYNNLYQNDLAKYNEIMSREGEYKKLLKEDQARQHITASALLMNTKGSLDSKIAGYSDLKRVMGLQFLNPVKNELFDGKEREVANCILLCGPTGCGKTVVAETMANETACFVDKVPTSTDPRKFPGVVRKKIKEASKRYFERLEKIEELKNSEKFKNMTEEQQKQALLNIGSARTVILIDEFDKYFNPIIVEEPVRIKNRDYLKAAFDGCAELPKSGMGKAVGVTFLCTTNYPSRVDDDLGVGKCDKYGILPPSGQDMIDVIKFYLNSANTMINDYIEDIPQLREIDVENLNLKKFVEHHAPNEEKGAFSNDAIQYLVFDAVDDYIENPKYDFTLHLIRKFKNSPRDITPQKYKKYLEELNKYDLDANKDLPDKNKVSRIEYLKALIERDEEILDLLSESELEQFNAWKKEYEELTKNEGEN